MSLDGERLDPSSSDEEIIHLPQYGPTYVPNNNFQNIFSNLRNFVYHYLHVSEQHGDARIAKSSIRYLLAFLSMIGFTIVYLLRVNMSVAIIAMTDNSTSVNHTSFNWTEAEKNEILGSFFYGYASSNLLAGLLADKFSCGASLLGYGVGGTAVFSAFTPIFASWGVKWICLLRIIEGFFEGVTFPAAFALWSNWAPKDERTTLQASSMNGATLGTVCGLAITGVLAKMPTIGWEGSFYIFSIIGIVWTGIWFMIASNIPETNAWITKYERDLIRESIDKPSDKKFPWKHCFSSKIFYVLVGSHFCQAWGNYMGIMEIPLFVNEVLHLDVTKSGLFTAIPNVIAFVFSLGFAMLVDHFLKKGHDVTKTRKITQLIAFIGPSVCLALLIYIEKLVDYQVLVLLTFTSVFGILTTSGLLSSFLDTCGQFSATVFGLSNSLANCTGFLVPALTGFFTGFLEKL